VLVFSLLYMLPLPLGALGYRSYYWALQLSAAVHAVELYKYFGRPRFDKEYLAGLIRGGNIHLIVFPLLFTAHPHPLPTMLFAVGAVKILRASDWLYDRPAVATYAPFVRKIIDFVGAKAGPVFLSTPADELQRLSAGARKKLVSQRLSFLIAAAEIATAIILLLEVFTSRRNLLTLVAMWQLLGLRFTLNADTRTAFTALDARISSLTMHPRCPPIVNPGYEKLRTFLRGFAKTEEELQEMAQQQAQGGAQTPKCTIM
jgi:hypothetical protein